MDNQFSQVGMADNQKSEDFDQLLAIMEAIPGILYMAKAPMPLKTHFISDELKRMLGYQPQEFIEDPNFWGNCIFEEDRPAVDDYLTKFAASDKLTDTIDYRMWAKGRISLIWIRDHFHAKRAQDGGIELLYGVMTDISEQKIAEAAKKETEEKLSIFFSSINDAIFVHPFAEQGFEPFVEVNDIACKRYGYSRDEFLSMSAPDVTFPIDANAHGAKKFRQQLLEKGHLIFETTHIKRTGEKFPVELNSNIIHIADRPYILAVVRDISERIQSTQEIAKRENTLQSIYRAAPIGIGIVKNRVFTFVNEGFCRMIGYEDSELLNRNARLVYPSQEEYDFVVKEKYAQIESRGVGSVETILKKKDGELLPIIMSSTWLNPNDHSMGSVFTVSDISELKRIQTELEGAKERAEESDRLKSAFLANMSHEIRTPMNAIIGFSELIAESDLIPELRHQYIKQVVQNSNQLLSIVNDILDISRIEAGEIRLSPEVVNLNEFLADLRKNYEMQTSERSLQLIIHPVKQSPETVLHVDRTKLRQILENLIVNAIKFTEGGYVFFGFELKDHEVEFFVEDTGIGIPDNLLDKIFERFHQEENYLNKYHRGTGLGLPICKKLVELMGGEITVASELNQGTKFRFSIPKGAVH